MNSPCTLLVGCLGVYNVCIAIPYFHNSAQGEYAVNSLTCIITLQLPIVRHFKPF